MREPILLLKFRHGSASLVITCHRRRLLVTHLPLRDLNPLLAEHSGERGVRDTQLASEGPHAVTCPGAVDELRDLDAAEALRQLVASVRIWGAQTLLTIARNREIPQFYRGKGQLPMVRTEVA